MVARSLIAALMFRSTALDAVPQAPVWLRGYRAVLVNEAAEHVVATGLERRGSGGDPSSGGHLKVDATTGPLLVVATDVVPKDVFEMAMAQNEQHVEAFGANRPHPAPRDPPGPRRSNGRPKQPIGRA